MTATESKAVLDARAEADQARARLLATARELQFRASPRTLARDAWSGAKEKGAGLADQAVDVVSQRPVTAGAVAAAVALFAARKPLRHMAGRLFNHDSNNGDADEPQRADEESRWQRADRV